MSSFTPLRRKLSAIALTAALSLGALAAIPTTASAAPTQGHVVLIGGAIKPGDTPSEAIIQEIVDLAQAHAGVGNTPRVAILTAASPVAPDAAEAADGDTYDNATANGLYYKSWFEAHGAEVYPVPIDVNQVEDYAGDPYTAANAFDTTVANEIRNSDAVYFGGGDQTRYVRSLFNCTAPDQAAADKFAYTACTDTPAMAAIREVVESGGVAAGTSAGLTIQQGADMISGGDPYQSWRDPAVTGWFDDNSADASTLAYIPAGGLGFFTEGQLDSHFARRDRQPRLVKLSLETQHERGFGVEEKTALVVDRGARTGKVIGALGATMLDVSDATFDGKSTAGVRYSYFMTGSTIDFATGSITLAGTEHTGPGTAPAPAAEPDIWKSYECDSNPYIFGTLSLAQSFVKSSVSRASGDSCDAAAESPRFRTTFNRDDRTRWSDDGSFVDVAMSIAEIPSFTATASVSGSTQLTVGDTASIAVSVTNTGGVPLSEFSINGVPAAATTVLPGATAILTATHTVTEGRQTIAATVAANAVDTNGANLNMTVESQAVSAELSGTAKPVDPEGPKKPGTEKPDPKTPVNGPANPPQALATTGNPASLGATSAIALLVAGGAALAFTRRRTSS
ncbi:cyanophycinase [Leucobacter coleopterorum]|uniref:Cyanophycinase n=1 Tax=Leucobacter coleopterorum TaxID=2714933 RepID=A0ABX6K176_9MICO|nr:cyanophycinase [Leucobacter coleopterorum]QIM18964.1 cyanophycinase [Leucobacter coleopterorum]